MKILITGAHGMVGKRLMLKLEKSSHQLICPSRIDLDLSNQAHTEQYFKHHKPDFIFHLAAIVGGIADGQSHRFHFLYGNTIIGANVIDAAIKSGCTRLINLSSACVYPIGLDILKESDLLNGSIDNTRPEYALSKLSALLMCEYASHEFQLQYKTVVACNLYGPGGSYDEQRAHFMPAMIRKLHDAKMTHQPSVAIWGDGSARRDLLYVDDLVNFLASCIENIEKLPGYINIGSNIDYSINEFCQIAAEVIGYKGTFIHDLTKPTGVKKRLLDPTLAREMGWQPRVDLKSGITETYQDYLSYIGKVASNY